MDSFSSDDPPPLKLKTENLVFSEASLNELAKAVINEGKIGMLAFYIYLNIPMVTIIQILNGYMGLQDTDEALLADLSRTYMELWKSFKDGVKDREKLADLDRALRYSERMEMADMVKERYTGNVELTLEALLASSI